MATFTISENFGTYQGNTSYINDGNSSNLWQANEQQSSGKYVLLTSSELIYVKSVTYYTSNSSEVFKSGAYLQVSSDGSNYTDIEQFDGEQKKTFTVNKECKYIRIYCKSGSNYVSISELTIDYSSISTTNYTVSVQAGDGVTVDKSGSNVVRENDNFELSIQGTISTITDNGIDVKNKLVEHTPSTGGDISSYPASYTTSGKISGTRYKNCIGKGSSTTATGNDYASGGSSSTASITYSFDFSGIPENATIESVEVKVGGHAENTSRSTATLQLYSGNTTKGSQSKFTSTSKQIITMSSGTWTRAELQEAKLRFTIGYYGGLVNGVDFSVTYSVPGFDTVYYTYTITSVVGNHEIFVNASVPQYTNVRIKIDGQQYKVLKIFKKRDNSIVSATEDDIKSIEFYILK